MSDDEKKPLPTPFRSFVCDGCGEKIVDVVSGVVEWVEDGGAPRDFRICHAPPAVASTKPKCTKYVGKMIAGHAPLARSSGQDGAAFVLARMSDMCINGVTYTAFMEAEEVFKRLSVPYYEEARRHMTSAESDGYFDGRDPDDATRQASLREMLQIYG
jgi:hypothetical protein